MTTKKLHPGLPDGKLLPQPDRARGAVRERPDEELRGDALDGGGALLCGRGPAHLPGLGLLWGRSGHFPVSRNENTRLVHSHWSRSVQTVL